MSHPRQASAVPEFPYLHPQVCWVLVTGEGEVLNPAGTAQRLDAASMVQQGRARLFIAWPGRTRTDLFSVDDQAALDQVVLLLSSGVSL